MTFLVVALIVLSIVTLIINYRFQPKNIDELRRIAANRATVVPPRPFTTDACTLWPNTLFGEDISNLCVEHDMEYWKGGTPIERKRADEKLRDSVNKVLFPFGTLMYFGTRLFGHRLIPAPWRWGYGFNYPYRHKN